MTPDTLLADLPATPPPDADKMDSDDEFNSSMSGNDFDDDTDDMDLEEGKELAMTVQRHC